MNKRIVFTGGPGGGKTSVLTYLHRLGYECAPESGRRVIQDQTASGGMALPWKDKTAFRDQMAMQEILNHKQYTGSDIMFYDRSIIDCYGYSQLEQIFLSTDLINRCNELMYNPKVFIFPPWEEIYENDAERRQDFSQAVATYYEMVKAYRNFGYKLIEVPKTSVVERAEFIINQLSVRGIV
ncbi:AAA family ATPase [Vibrio pectenicida]|uniref:ATP-binding protein n=1 Tax=Vibrio pectenicida TaxID=62763 RepID=A0A3R9F7K9_9VIBR|nr:AAA family ATPase [Vibrio pectenicida]RSD31679.1 ATP-binding protein [Vibrio pectenicida]